jgi:SAM-dependent methyltransferase
LQVSLTRRKLADLPQAHVSRGDAADPNEERVDVVTCFFLLHEVPDAVKIQITRAMLELVKPGGRAVFVDYHRPHPFHPLKPLMRKIFDWLEPFARSIWSREFVISRAQLVTSFAGASVRASVACIRSSWLSVADAPAQPCADISPGRARSSAS